MLRWLHLSDFHVGKDGYGHAQLYPQLLDHVQKRIAAGLRPDAVVITGDVADKGGGVQYQEFTASLLAPLKTMVTPGCPIFLVPGNHDVDRALAETTVSYDHAKNFQDYFDPTDGGHRHRAPSFPRFEAYHAFLAGEGLELQRLDGVRPYYAVRQAIRGMAVGIVGLNTAWLSQDPTGKGTKSREGVWEERECLTPGLASTRAALNDVKGCDLILVLGHHPLSWFWAHDQEPCKALFGQHRVIYLHGHLHRTATQVDEGGGHLFRTLQAGAAFPAREEDEWRNRFLWCELDLPGGQVVAQPWTWSRVHQGWVLDADAYADALRKGDAWHLPVPWMARAVAAGAVAAPGPGWSAWTPPSGWIAVDHDFLSGHSRPLTDEEVVAYFDGAIPTWRHALSNQIPRRGLVHELARLFRSYGGGKPLIRLVSGAGGEGKSTELRQVVCELASSKPAWRALWAERQGAALRIEDVLALPDELGPWVVASDDAEWVAKVCAEAARALWEKGRKGIHFLLAARDTDWKALGADKLTWSSWSDFETVVLRGVSPADAALVVEKWSAAGDRGLGALINVPAEERAGMLRTAAEVEAGRPDGSFLGAMLRIRMGEGLRDHVRSVMQRLSERAGVRDHSLLDAFLFVAAPHAVNILTLTLDVLAEALGAEASMVWTRVVFPLGEEAAANVDGRVILARHRAIAEAALALAVEEFGKDDGDYYEGLVRATSRLRPRQRILGFRDFNYLSTRFREELGRPGLAVRLAAALVDQVPTNRHYLGELGVSHGQNGCPALNACMSLAKLADFEGVAPPENDHARLGLASLGHAFGALHERTGESLFIQARGAVADLGLTLRLNRQTQEHFDEHLAAAEAAGVESVDPRTALRRIEEAVERAWQIREGEWPGKVPIPTALRFNGLATLFGLR